MLKGGFKQRGARRALRSKTIEHCRLVATALQQCGKGLGVAQFEIATVIALPTKFIGPVHGDHQITREAGALEVVLDVAGIGVSRSRL